MHSVLQVQEVLSQIFGSCRMYKSELLDFVLVCQAFKEPALDVLWKEVSCELYSDDPTEGGDPAEMSQCFRSLLECLPPDLIELAEGKPAVGYLHSCCLMWG